LGDSTGGGGGASGTADVTAIAGAGASDATGTAALDAFEARGTFNGVATADNPAALAAGLAWSSVAGEGDTLSDVARGSVPWFVTAASGVASFDTGSAHPAIEPITAKHATLAAKKRRMFIPYTKSRAL
jgi:hypothetical protein